MPPGSVLSREQIQEKCAWEGEFNGVNNIIQLSGEINYSEIFIFYDNIYRKKCAYRLTL
jgi:hypothetical protein